MGLIPCEYVGGAKSVVAFRGSCRGTKLAPANRVTQRVSATADQLGCLGCTEEELGSGFSCHASMFTGRAATTRGWVRSSPGPA